MMKIAFCNRKNYNNPLGGDGIQMLKTKYYLELNFNLKITILTSAEELDETFDIVHIFNYLTIKETRQFFEKANALNLKIVSSSIYWDYSYSSTHVFSKLFGTPNFINEQYISLLRKIIFATAQITNRPIGISPKFRKNCQYFMNSSKYILPNSVEEGQKLIEFCGDIEGKNADKMRVVYNATDFEVKNMLNNSDIEEKEFLLKYQIPSNYILQVGRIEYLKNQLNLLFALRECKHIPIVFVGKVVENTYFNKLNRIAHKRGNVFFIPNVEHFDIQKFYKYAKVHVLLSLRESPGLVSLEADSMQCPIVVSDERFAPTKTYFKNSAFIANPLNESDIKEKVLNAYSGKIEKLTFGEFTWTKAAEQTYKVYLECINNL